MKSKKGDFMKTKKANLNYFIDLLIAIFFIISAVSGLILLSNNQIGYAGGRNLSFNRGYFYQNPSNFYNHYLTRNLTKDIHNWSSILMIVGVILHFLLHWDWLKCMTKNLMGIL
jgi:hypothetical protein